MIDWNVWDYIILLLLLQHFAWVYCKLSFASIIVHAVSGSEYAVSGSEYTAPVQREGDGSSTRDHSSIGVVDGSDGSEFVPTATRYSINAENSAPSKLTSSSSVKGQSSGHGLSSGHDQDYHTRSKNRVRGAKGDTVHQLRLKLSDRVTKAVGVTKIYEDFVKCDIAWVSDRVRDEMRQQWSSSLFPILKIKDCNETVSAIVLECNYISKLSADCLYYYVTAKASIKILESNSVKEVQFRDVMLINSN